MRRIRSWHSRRNGRDGRGGRRRSITVDSLLDSVGLLLLLEDGVVAETVAFRLFAVVACRVSLVALNRWKER